MRTNPAYANKKVRKCNKCKAFVNDICLFGRPLKKDPHISPASGECPKPLTSLKLSDYIKILDNAIENSKEFRKSMDTAIPICPICSIKSTEVTGKEIYPHRTDLFDLKFYQCLNHKDFYVGCHKHNGKPLGILADSEHRALKMQCHYFFDKHWLIKSLKKEELRNLRKAYYSKLATAMNLTIDQTHFGMFTKEQCKQALAIIKEWDFE